MTLTLHCPREPRGFLDPADASRLYDPRPDLMPKLKRLGDASGMAARSPPFESGIATRRRLAASLLYERPSCSPDGHDLPGTLTATSRVVGSDMPGRPGVDDITKLTERAPSAP